MVEVSSKIFDSSDVMAYGVFREVTTLELFQHHFSQTGHRGCLLVTRIYLSRQPPIDPLPHAQASAAQAASFLPTIRAQSKQSI
jgi:hypothetical protein